MRNRQTHLGDFVLKENQQHSVPIIIQDGNLTLETNASFLDEVTFINHHKAVLMHNHSFIYHLIMMNGGDIYCMDENVLIDELTIEGHVIIHVPNSSCELTDFVNRINGVYYKVVRDID